jgi:hypothetical protein
MKYRATMAGFIDRLINVGDVVEIDGPPPIAGLVPIDEKPQTVPAEIPVPKPSARQSRRQRQEPPDAAGDKADII